MKRTEPVAEGALESRDPLRNGASRIVPFVGEPAFAAGEPVSLFLVAYPGAGDAADAARPSLTFEFLARRRGRGPIDRRALPAPDAAGHIPYVASVPTQSLAPGRYEVAATVSQGDTAARERAFFTIEGPEQKPGS